MPEWARWAQGRLGEWQGFSSYSEDGPPGPALSKAGSWHFLRGACSLRSLCGCETRRVASFSPFPFAGWMLRNSVGSRDTRSSAPARGRAGRDQSRTPPRSLLPAWASRLRAPRGAQLCRGGGAGSSIPRSPFPATAAAPKAAWAAGPASHRIASHRIAARGKEGAGGAVPQPACPEPGATAAAPAAGRAEAGGAARGAAEMPRWGFLPCLYRLCGRFRTQLGLASFSLPCRHGGS